MTDKNNTNDFREQQEALLTEVLDPVDIAQLAAQQELDSILENHRLKMLPETHPDFDNEHCIGCGQAIVAERLVMKKIRRLTQNKIK
jgi:RNA polymerase-binding transcription factor DksA